MNGFNYFLPGKLCFFMTTPSHDAQNTRKKKEDTNQKNYIII